MEEKIFEMIKTIRQEQQKQYLRLMFYTAVSDNTRPNNTMVHNTPRIMVQNTFRARS